MTVVRRKADGQNVRDIVCAELLRLDCSLGKLNQKVVVERGPVEHVVIRLVGCGGSTRKGFSPAAAFTADHGLPSDRSTTRLLLNFITQSGICLK